MNDTWYSLDKEEWRRSTIIRWFKVMRGRCPSDARSAFELLGDFRGETSYMRTPTKKLRQDGKPFVRWVELMHEEGLVSALVDAALYDELNIDATEGKFVNRAHVDENSPRHQKLRLDLKNVVTTRWDLWDRTGPSAFSLNQRIGSDERSLRGRVCYCTKFCHCYDDPKQPRINLPRIF